MDFDRIKREKFVDNNARVLRAINLLGKNYAKMKDLEYGLGDELTRSEITDCTNYLNEGGYIKLRETVGHNRVEDMADAETDKLEAKLTAKGIALLNGNIKDPCIRW